MRNRKNLIHSFAKTLLITLLCTFGVGEMWGTSRTFKSGEKIYFKDASGNISWGDLKCLWVVSTGNVYAHFWNDTESATSSWGNAVSGSKNNANTIYEITVPGSGKEFTHVIFTRGDESNKFWNQTTDQYPDESYNMFCISNDGYYSTSQSPNHQWYGTWDRFSTGSLCGDFNNWDPDKGKFTDGRVILELEASTAYGFKVLKGDGTVLDNWYGLNSGNITNTTSSWWTLKSKENNCTVTSGEAGEYCFHWDGSTLGVYYPQARFSASQYIYFNVEGETGWKDNGNKVMFWTKYYDSNTNNPDGGLTCNTPVETYVYYTQIPSNDYIGKVQLNLYDGSTYKSSSAVAYAYNRSSSSQNCMIEESGKESASGNEDWTPQWTTYCPPTTSETFADNSTETISWQDGSNDGSSSAKAIWVKTGTDLKVIASATKVVPDGNMTVKYDFKVNNTSQQNTTIASYSHSASTNNTLYKLSVDAYTNYNLDNTKNSTKHTPDTIYYKALNTYSVTHTLSNVTKSSGRAGTDAAAYHVSYAATYTANAGYYLPSDVTVTIGGVTKTKGMDYTWTVTSGTSGTLTILTDKIDGNVVVTVNGELGTAFIQANFQVYNEDRSVRTKTGDSYTHGSTSIWMKHEGGHYVLHTYSTPAELAEQVNSAAAYFYIKTSTADNALENTVSYQAVAYASGGNNQLSANGSGNRLPVSTTDNRGFCFTGSENGYVIIHFNGTHVWYELECALSYNGNGNTGGSTPAVRTYYEYGDPQTAEANTYTKTGYTFTNWNTASDGGGTTYAAGATKVAMNAAEVVLHAQWTINNHDITYTTPSHGSYTIKAGDASAVSEDIDDVDYNTTVTLAATPETGYSFSSWSVTGGIAADASSANTTFSMPDNDVTVAATFSENNYTVTVSAGAGGSVDETSVSAGVATASTTIKASPNPGYYFTGWTIPDGVTVASGYGTNAITINATAGDLTITANFALRWSVSGNWKTLPESSAWDADYYTMGTITKEGDYDVCSIDIDGLSANTTYRFKIVDRNASQYSWYGYGTSQTDITYTTEDLPWTLDAGEGNTAEIGLQTAAAGTYTFKWNMNQHKLTVTYPTSYQITMAMDPNTGGGAISPAEGTFWVGTDAFDIVATPNYSHYFNGWTSSNGGSFQDDDASQASTKFTATANTTLTASMPERTAFIEGDITIYDDATRTTQIKPASKNLATNIRMELVNDKYVLHTYTTPADFAEQVNNTGAYFYIKTSTSSSSLVDTVGYHPVPYSEGGDRNLSGKGNALPAVTRGARAYAFTGTEDGYVIIYFDGSEVWYELECALSYNGNTGTGSGPARTFYDYGVAQTAAAAGTYTLSGYDFSHWNTKADNSGTTYAAGASIPMTAAEDTLYAQWKFVIYRTGDKADDTNKTPNSVESYAGGTLAWPIEYRMKVSTLDQWYSLYLPFDVDAVQVIEDGIYYDIVPYYRPTIGGTYYLGHYVIRTPAKTSDFPIKDFDDWRDPDNYDVLPSKNTPYIILWHDEYFLNKYIAFCGHTDETIPTEMTPGDRPDKDSVVNVYGNNAMVIGSVEDGYTLEADYGQGAWLREDEIGASRTVQPFECYLRANAVTTPIFKAVRRQDVTTDIPMTDDPSPRTDKFLINGQVVIIRDNKMYNILGMEIQ